MVRESKGREGMVRKGGRERRECKEGERRECKEGERREGKGG
jgi:hypothetical protein